MLARRLSRAFQRYAQLRCATRIAHGGSATLQLANYCALHAFSPDRNSARLRHDISGYTGVLENRKSALESCVEAAFSAKTRA